MRAINVPPFASLIGDESAGDVIAAGPWLHSADGFAPLEASIDGWDYGMPLAVERQLDVDHAHLMERCGLARGSRVRLVASWETGQGLHLAEVPFRIDLLLREGSRSTIDLEMRVPSDRLAATLTLHTRIVLISSGEGSEQFAARLNGSVLWEDQRHVALEGDAPRFPIGIVDFAERFPQREQEAPWTIVFAPDWLHQHPSVGVQALVNSRRDDIVQAIRGAAGKEAAKVVRAALLFETANAMLEAALQDDDFLKTPEIFAEGTLGAAIRSHARAVFGLSTRMTDLAELKRRDPAAYVRTLQGTLGHLRG